MKLQFVGNVAGAENATVKATVTYLNDYRDPDGQAPPPVLLFRRLPGQEWTAQPDGGAAWVWGPGLPSDPAARVRVAYAVERPGLPPFGRVVERRIMPNTDLPGYWDWTRPDEAQPAFAGGHADPTPVTVLPGQGPQGERGPGLLLGAGPPSPAVGRSGDTYLNTAAWDIYSRGAMGWTLIGNIRGGTGGTGPRGEPGVGVPLHTTVENGAVLVAGNGPAVTAWKQLRALGLHLAMLADIDLSTPPTDGQALVWNAAAGKWRPGNVTASDSTPTTPPSVEPFAVTTDAEGFQTITNASVTTDDLGFQTIQNAAATADGDGFETVQRSTS